MRVFDITFDYKTDVPPGKDPDAHSQRLKEDHQLLWTKELPAKGPAERKLFQPEIPEDPKVRRKNYLMYDQPSEKSFTVGSDAITNSYTTWSRPKALVEAKKHLTDEQQLRYFNPPYTIGSAMIWPVRAIHLPAMNPARGTHPKIADRMDLTLECIRRHYNEESGSPLAGVTTNYADFFELFGTFEQFVDFFHLQDLVTKEGKVDFFLNEDEDDVFKRPGVPIMKDEYVAVQEKSLSFIAARGARMADWLEENHPDIEIRRAPTLAARRVFDITFDYKTDSAGRDPDSHSPRLKADHQLLWTKKLPGGELFDLQIPEDPKVRRSNYLVYAQSSDKRFRFGSDAITSSYTTWSRPKALVEAKKQLTDDQQIRYFNPPYTIGSAMIWPVRMIHKPTMNQARGTRPKIADRMDLTLECIRRHYAAEPGSPLEDVITNYADFFELFGTFEQFVDFFHFQDLVTKEGKVDFFLDEDEVFQRPGVPLTKDEYIKVRERSLDFISARRTRMVDWVEKNHPT